MQGHYQQFTLAGLLSFSMYGSQISKFKCLMCYFRRIYQAEKTGDNDFLSMHITVTRKTMDLEQDDTSWAECTQHLTSFHSLAEGLIENADGCLQVDFSKEYIGGEVLDLGNVQVSAGCLWKHGFATIYIKSVWYKLVLFIYQLFFTLNIQSE